jgi:hypothetical protein
LLFERRLRQIDEGRCIDIDIEESRRDRFARELLDAVYFSHGVDSEFLGVHLKVVALNEDRSAKSLSERSGEHHRDVFRGSLIRIRNLRSRDLQNECANLQSYGRAK